MYETSTVTLHSCESGAMDVVAIAYFYTQKE